MRRAVYDLECRLNAQMIIKYALSFLAEQQHYSHLLFENLVVDNSVL